MERRPVRRCGSGDGKALSADELCDRSWSVPSRCKDAHTTYFPGISTADDTWTEEALEEVGLKNQEEAKEQYAKRQEEKYSRLAQYSLDAENRKKYTEKTQEWQAIHSQFESKAAGNLGAPDDITDEWTVKVSRSGEVTDLMEYVTGKGKYKVDGKQVLLDYTEHERRVAERIAQLYGKRVQMIPRVTYHRGFQHRISG